jgi:shikimate kinase
MGTGKTAVGRHLAAELHATFVDVDTAITKKAGKSIQNIFAAEGETAFRELERSVIAEVAGQDKTVIATGGGALLDPKNREYLEKNGMLIYLKAKVGTLLERLKDDLTRPLLAGENLEQKVERLMKERQDVYNLCPVQVDTDGKTIAQVAQEIIKKVSPQWQN